MKRWRDKRTIMQIYATNNGWKLITIFPENIYVIKQGTLEECIQEIGKVETK